MAKNAYSCRSTTTTTTTGGTSIRNTHHKDDPNDHQKTHTHGYNRSNGTDLQFYPAFCFPASPTHFSWVKMSIADIQRLQTRKGFEGQSLFFYNNHPIQFVCMAGYIVSRNEYERLTVLTVDDSSGALLEVLVLKAAVRNNAQDESDTLESLPESASWAANAATGPEITHLTSTARTPIDISSIFLGAAVKIKGTLSCNNWPPALSTLTSTSTSTPPAPTTQMKVILERFWVLTDTNSEIQFWNERSRFLIDVLAEPWILTTDEIESLRQQAHNEETAVVKERQRARERRLRYEEREARYHRHLLMRWEAEEKLREKERVRIVRSNKTWLAERRRG